MFLLFSVAVCFQQQHTSTIDLECNTVKGLYVPFTYVYLFQLDFLPVKVHLDVSDTHSTVGQDSESLLLVRKPFPAFAVLYPPSC